MADDNLVPTGTVDSDSQLLQKAAGKLAEEPRVMEQMMAMGIGVMSGNPIQNKMTTEHIATVLEIAGKHDERQFEITKAGQDQEHQNTIANRQYAFAVFALVLLFVGVVMVVFKDKPDILTHVIGIVVGFAGGFGFGRSSKKAE